MANKQLSWAQQGQGSGTTDTHSDKLDNGDC